MIRVLIVGNDPAAGGLSARVGVDPVRAGDAAEALDRLSSEARGAELGLAALVVDLPAAEAEGLVEALRASGFELPIVVARARGGERGRIRVLEAGADDAVSGSISPRELAARVQAAVRRTGTQRGQLLAEAIQVGRLRIEPSQFQAFVDGANAGLTLTEFRVLHALALARGRVLTRAELMQRVWGRGPAPHDRTVDVCIKRLRDKIDRRAGQPLIRTRTGVGYVLLAPGRHDGAADEPLTTVAA